MSYQKIMISSIAIVLLAGCSTKQVATENQAVKRTEVIVMQGSNSYEISKSAWCSSNNATSDVRCQHDYPVSYRTKQWDDESNRVEYIYTPRNMVTY